MNELRIKFNFGEDSLSIHPFNWYIRPESDHLLSGSKSYNFLCFELVIAHRVKEEEYDA